MGVVRHYDWGSIYQRVALLKQEDETKGRDRSYIVAVKMLRTNSARGSYCQPETFGDNHMNYSFLYPGCGCCSDTIEGKIVAYKIQAFDADLNVVLEEKSE